MVVLHLDGFLDLVKSSRLKSNTNGLLVSLVGEASFEHFFDNELHLDINLDGLLEVDDFLSEPDVLVDALVDKSLNVESLLVQIEHLTCFKS